MSPPPAGPRSMRPAHPRRRPLVRVAHRRRRRLVRVAHRRRRRLVRAAHRLWRRPLVRAAHRRRRRPLVRAAHRRRRPLIGRVQLRAEAGQAAVELVALLPLAAALLLALWQLVLTAHAAWAATVAARAAARAHAVGSDARAAARDHLPTSLERGLAIATSAGEVRLAVRVPTLPGVPDLGHARATARFAPQ